MISHFPLRNIALSLIQMVKHDICAYILLLISNGDYYKTEPGDLNEDLRSVSMLVWTDHWKLRYRFKYVNNYIKKYIFD